MTATTDTDPRSPTYSVPFTVGSHHFRILSATTNEAEEFADVFWDAFRDDLLFKAMNGTADPEKIQASTTKSWEETWDARGNMWYKIVDEDKGNRYVAIAKWGFPHTPEENPTPPVQAPAVPGENEELKKAFFGGLLENRVKNWKKEDMYLMNMLAVRLEYQRLGLGGQLLAPVLRLADQEGRKAYIEASPAGKGLYEKFGWRKIDHFDLDLNEVPGVEGPGLVVHTALMMREPGSAGPGL